MFKLNGIIISLFFFTSSVNAQTPATPVEVQVQHEAPGPQSPGASTPTTTTTITTPPAQTQPAPSVTVTPPASAPTQAQPAPAAPTPVQPAPTPTPVQPATETTPPPARIQVQQPPATDTPAQAQVINCEFQPGTGPVTKETVALWAKNAAVQAFNFVPENIDGQLEKLQACFTNEGWQSFQNALQQSGNLDAMRHQQLAVTGTIDGQAIVSDVQENQWKAIVPMQVTYQNAQDRLVQMLSIELLIGRKPTGELGIMQTIATVRPTQPAT